jgi:hypothetical protein
MKYIRDTLHGFRERPHYEEAELDIMFEKLVSDFLRKKHGEVKFPISTDDLTTLIELDVSDLDQYADLTPYGEGVEGLTEFAKSGKPKVKISQDVHRYENRLRTTLTHEYGHVKLHGSLFALGDRQPSLGPNHKPNTIYCFRDSILPLGKKDWMEWQAGYASGAALMPKSYVIKTMGAVQQRLGIYGPVAADSGNGGALVSAVVKDFAVSREAATVRLKILKFIGAEPAARSLFS